MITDKISTRYLICTLHIFVSCPNVSDRWIRQLKIRNPFFTTNGPLGSNSANLDYSFKVDLQPVVVAVRDFRAPAIASSIVQTSVVRSVAAVISCGIRRSCNLVIRNYCRWRYANRIVETINLWNYFDETGLNSTEDEYGKCSAQVFFEHPLCHIRFSLFASPCIIM